MLFTDATISTVADLSAYESEVEEIAAVSAIDLDGKMQCAQAEVGFEVLATIAPRVSAGLSCSLDQVVVTDSLKLWHTFQTLALVYRDAYERKLNDKYLAKWNEYRSLARWAMNLYFNLGVGLVSRPLPAPGKPVLDSVPGASAEDITYFACVSWMRGSSESAAGASASCTVPAGEALRVSVAGLRAPTDADGWVPYVGLASGSEQRQVGAYCLLDEAWLMPESGLVTGPGLPTGQAPDVFREFARSLQRG